MAKAIWKGDASNALACGVFGIVFPAREERDVSALDERQLSKLKGNPQFDVIDAEAEEPLEVPAGPLQDERDALIEVGAELGLELNKRMSAETMRQRIAEAQEGLEEDDDE